MDDSDDYFQDLAELDENDLAALAEAEAKYAESISQVPTRVPGSLPPQKRQKVSHYYAPEDTPDVFLRPDGTYGVTAVKQGDEDELSIPKSLIVGGQRENVGQVQEVTSSCVLQSRHREQSTMEPSGENTSPARSTAHESVQAILGPTSAHFQQHSRDRLSSELQCELASLKATVELLKLENYTVNAALQDAETSRFAREGEVTMLRKKIETAAQQHTDDLVKLKEARETTGLEQARIQKELKQQVERLRTEYIFKQHEMESSSRKPLLSTRSRRTAIGLQMSPVPVPPAMREWNSTRALGVNKTNLSTETPSSRGNVTDHSRLNVPAKSRSDMRFPGFENSFLPSSPLHTPSRTRQPGSVLRDNSVARTPTKSRKDNGKQPSSGRARSNVLSPVKLPSLALRPPTGAVFDALQMDDFIQDFDADTGVNDGSPRSRCKSVGTGSSPNFDRGLDSVGELVFSDDIDRVSAADSGTFEGIDWGEELHYLLFSYVSPVANTLTFHFLLSADVPSQNYHQSCSAILEALGARYKFATAPDLMRTIAENLMSMAVILLDSERLRHLRALFELLSSTMVHIPSFTQAVLQAGVKKQVNDDLLLHIFSSMALGSLDVGKGYNNSEDYTMVLHSMLMFLETAAWTATEEFDSSLIPLLQSEGPLMTLLDNKQPSTVISRTISALVVLATHPSLIPPLLSSPSDDADFHVKQSNSPGPIRAPVLERLSSFLVDAGPLTSLKADEELSSILNFFTRVTDKNPEGRSALIRSGTFIPCLIHYLTRLSSALWEDDELIMQSPDRAKSTVLNMKQALFLLHQLVLRAPSDDPSALDFDFRQKLFYVPHAMFNGLPHMFVVMIGRLSYADPPEWLDGDLQVEVEKLTEPARDLMDLVIEGPESDSVWVAYQDSEGESISKNDDELEADLLDADNQD